MLELILSFLIETPSKIHLEPVHTAQAYYREETKQEIVDRVARETDFDAQIIRNVIDSETGRTWDCTLKGKDGEIGCLQIIQKFHPNVDPTDFEASVRYFVSEYQAGMGYAWVGCNCYSYATLYGTKLPPARDIRPNSSPLPGTIVIMQYAEKHYAIIEKLTEEGMWVKEANYEPCKIAPRFIKWNDPAIVGFYSATSH